METRALIKTLLKKMEADRHDVTMNLKLREGCEDLLSSIVVVFFLI